MVSQRVTVEGAVQHAGSYPILPRMTLQRSIASAQGLSEFAKSSEVVVFRSIDGAHYATLYDLKAIREGRYDDPAIYPNDIVVVGESRASRLFNDLVPAAASLLSPLTILLTR
jgi:polysaccharide export outer membrane protein